MFCMLCILALVINLHVHFDYMLTLSHCYCYRSSCCLAEHELVLQFDIGEVGIWAVLCHKKLIFIAL